MTVGFLHHFCQLSYNCKLDEFEPPKLASYMGCLGHLMAVHVICINFLLCTQTITFAMAGKVVAALILLLVSAEAGEHRRWCDVRGGGVGCGVRCTVR